MVLFFFFPKKKLGQIVYFLIVKVRFSFQILFFFSLNHQKTLDHGNLSVEELVAIYIS